MNLVTFLLILVLVFFSIKDGRKIIEMEKRIQQLESKQLNNTNTEPRYMPSGVHL